MAAMNGRGPLAASYVTERMEFVTLIDKPLLRISQRLQISQTSSSLVSGRASIKSAGFPMIFVPARGTPFGASIPKKRTAVAAPSFLLFRSSSRAWL